MHQNFRIGMSLFQEILHHIPIFRLTEVTSICCLPEQFQIPTFASEWNFCHIRQCGKQSNTAQCKHLCRCNGIWYGQFNHQIHAGFHCQFCTCKLIHHGNIAPLHKVSAHDRNNGFGSIFPHLLNLIKMSVVQWIVFTNNSGNFHAFAASSPVDFCRLVSKKVYLCPLNSGHCFTILHEMVKFCNAIS